MRQAKVVEKINTHFTFNNIFPENRIVYDTMWKNVVQPEQATDNNIMCISFACRMTKTTDTHTEYAIIFAFLGQQWLSEPASMLRYLQCRSFYIYFQATWPCIRYHSHEWRAGLSRDLEAGICNVFQTIKSVETDKIQK
jgi:hypothetical protein